jgi:hypothetical protein
MRVFKREDALLPSQLASVAEEAFGVDSKVLKAIGGAGEMWKVYDRAASRFHRTLAEAGRRQGKKGELSRLLDSFYRKGIQDTPIGPTTRVVGKLMYPFVRFLSDPRYWAMNIVEADLLGGVRHGVVGKAKQQAAAHESAALLTHEQGRMPKLGSKIDDPALAEYDTGTFVEGRRQAGYVRYSFDKGRARNVEEMLDNMPKDDPVIRAMTEKFPDLPREQWAKQLDDMLYGFDTKGVKATLDDEFEAIVAREAWTAEEAAAFEPFLQRLYELNEGTFQSIVTMFYGNANRSTLERVLNSYWLYWPISYQIKAGKWLYDVLTKGAFGGRTNLVGALRFDQLVDFHMDRLASDPEYAQHFEDYDDTWHAAQMFVPITPQGMGVSLNRLVRYAGAAAELFDPYEGVDDPLNAVIKTLEFGPLYTKQLLQRVAAEHRSE